MALGTGSRGLTPERFARGMTFEQYMHFMGTPENLAREAGWWAGTVRVDWSGRLRAWYEDLRLRDDQIAAVRWLAAQPHGPAKVLAISEEWSSDCRRDVTILGRLAEVGPLELRVFSRDGQRVGRAPRADPAESPNADLMNAFLRERDGQTYQSIPIVAFYTRDFEYLYHYTERPAIYHPLDLSTAMQMRHRGENREVAWERFLRDWGAMQQSPIFKVWAFAAIDEMLSALYERHVARLAGGGA